MRASRHLVGGHAGAGHGIRGREGDLFDLCEVVGGVLIQGEGTDLDTRVVSQGPHLGQVEGVEAVGLRILVGHDQRRGSRRGSCLP